MWSRNELWRQNARLISRTWLHATLNRFVWRACIPAAQAAEMLLARHRLYRASEVFTRLIQWLMVTSIKRLKMPEKAT